ncbi:MAG TPA: phosphate signaling complex protein PhoU [Planctomycetota bacterium]|nr:phosphate signaling complex protein PhoU [Planctomycetota bacterium]HRR79561.1 phosphate signaling complex protein PhoU [Planctomycetota bacterium]HRT94404.1 phosphate signaling complex protein PhoU [Planctomycetota bacterium]
MDSHQRQFDRELHDLKKRLLRMATLAEEMIDRAVTELIERDEKLTEAVARAEDEVNRLQIEIDEEALRLLATRQPVASDLRFIVAATKINSDLERIGDLVVNITENVHVLAQQPPLKPLIDIPRMADLARQMVRKSIDAFVKGDVLLAQAVIMTDDQMDALKDQVLRELLTYMMSDPHTIERALALILVARHLERIGDHATNIAEDVIYLIQGRDVRHPKTPRATPPEGSQP